ncbi:MAG: AzlC family ABC transporter permease [Clostridia bacterium]|nr:AzlC family ABC transporter permease [Clostridia bacterium]
MATERRKQFFKGLKDGFPIFLGYFAVSLTLGIHLHEYGLTPLQGTLASLTNHTSAGELIGFQTIASDSGYWVLILAEIVANARYLLMSFALSQKIDPKTPLWQRLLMGHGVTDEIFSISVSVPGKLDPFYTYGAITAALPGWTGGTLVGAILGNVLPVRFVSALSVGLYGMFIAAFIPPAKKDRVMAGLIAVCFALSWVFNKLPIFDGLDGGLKIIILTVVIASAAAILFPRKEASDGEA